MVFEIKSFEIISFQRHPNLRDHVRASVSAGISEIYGSHLLHLRLRVIVEEDQPDEAVRAAVLHTAARVIRRINAALSPGKIAVAAE